MALAALLGLALAATAPGDCAADPQLSYICGPVKPEDVLALPGTKWLIASGFSPGAGLKLIDSTARTYRQWYTGSAEQAAADQAAYPGCPGSPDPALLNTRGLSLRQTGKQRWRLLVVNHGGREAIEVFDIATSGTKPPSLTWRGCLPLPPGQVGNSVASFADGTVLVTVLTRPGTTIADFVQGRNTGAVWSWSPGAASFVVLPGTRLPGNNGLEVDPDQKHFYTVAFGWHAVMVYDRRDTAKPLARIEAPGFMPDNIHWSGGRLLLAGMRLDEPACGGLRRVVDGVADPMLCHRSWVVGELDAKRRRIAVVAEGPPQPGFNGLSAAAISGNELWLGSFQSNRLAYLPLPRALQRGPRR
jgi:hypothetical protein